MAQYDDKILDHNIDGIEEYDNPLPGWLMSILWGSMAFAIVYIGYYALAFGPASWEAEYRVDEVAERAAVQAHWDANPVEPPTTAALLAAAQNDEILEAGRVSFIKTCAACHGEEGQGLIGPNLSDDRWLHGGKVVQIYNTIAKGVPGKGMPPWRRALVPDDLFAVAAFVRSLQGTSPKNPKPPEGELQTPEPFQQP